MKLWRNARLATLAHDVAWGWIERGALLVDGETLAWVGAEADLPTDLAVDAEHDLGGALVTPGLVDCHTHLVYGGQRAQEFELRLQGASYEDIARAGGGIRSTVAATRAASDESLFDSARLRALALMAEGVTTLEIKSWLRLGSRSRSESENAARCAPRRRRVAGRGENHLSWRACAGARICRPRRRLYRYYLPFQLPALVAPSLVDAFCEASVGQ